MSGIEEYIKRWPNEKFDNTSVASQLRELPEASNRLYVEVQNIWMRLKATERELELLRNTAKLVVEELNDLLEE